MGYPSTHWRSPCFVSQSFKWVFSCFKISYTYVKNFNLSHSLFLALIPPFPTETFLTSKSLATFLSLCVCVTPASLIKVSYKNLGICYSQEMGDSSIVTLLKKVSHHPFSSHHDVSLREERHDVSLMKPHPFKWWKGEGPNKSCAGANSSNKFRRELTRPCPENTVSSRVSLASSS